MTMCFTAKTYTSSMSTLGALNARLPLTYLRKKRLYEPIIRNCRPQHLGNTELEGILSHISTTRPVIKRKFNSCNLNTHR